MVGAIWPPPVRASWQSGNQKTWLWACDSLRALQQAVVWPKFYASLLCHLWRLAWERPRTRLSALNKHFPRVRRWKTHVWTLEMLRKRVLKAQKAQKTFHSTYAPLTGTCEFANVLPWHLFCLDLKTSPACHGCIASCGQLGSKSFLLHSGRLNGFLTLCAFKNTLSWHFWSPNMSFSPSNSRKMLVLSLFRGTGSTPCLGTIMEQIVSTASPAPKKAQNEPFSKVWKWKTPVWTAEMPRTSVLNAQKAKSPLNLLERGRNLLPWDGWKRLCPKEAKKWRTRALRTRSGRSFFRSEVGWPHYNILVYA